MFNQSEYETEVEAGQPEFVTQDEMYQAIDEVNKEMLSLEERNRQTREGCSKALNTIQTVEKNYTEYATELQRMFDEDIPERIQQEVDIAMNKVRKEIVGIEDDQTDLTKEVKELTDENSDLRAKLEIANKRFWRLAHYIADREVETDKRNQMLNEKLDKVLALLGSGKQTLQFPVAESSSAGPSRSTGAGQVSTLASNLTTALGHPFASGGVHASDKAKLTSAKPRAGSTAVDAANQSNASTNTPEGQGGNTEEDDAMENFVDDDNTENGEADDDELEKSEIVEDEVKEVNKSSVTAPKPAPRSQAKATNSTAAHAAKPTAKTATKKQANETKATKAEGATRTNTEISKATTGEFVKKKEKAAAKAQGSKTDEAAPLRGASSAADREKTVAKVANTAATKRKRDIAAEEEKESEGGDVARPAKKLAPKAKIASKAPTQAVQKRSASRTGLRSASRASSRATSPAPPSPPLEIAAPRAKSSVRAPERKKAPSKLKAINEDDGEEESRDEEDDVPLVQRGRPGSNATQRIPGKESSRAVSKAPSKPSSRQPSRTRSKLASREASLAPEGPTAGGKKRKTPAGKMPNTEEEEEEPKATRPQKRPRAKKPVVSATGDPAEIAPASELTGTVAQRVRKKQAAVRPNAFKPVKMKDVKKFFKD